MSRNTISARLSRFAAGAALAAAITISGFQLFSEAATNEKAPRPKYGPDATRLTDDRDYVIENQAPDFWALMPYYLPQQTGSACSIASIAMVMNGLRADQNLHASDSLVTQNNLLKKTGAKSWEKATGPRGGGVTLDQLGKYVLKALHAHGFKDAKVEVVHAQSTEQFQDKLSHALAENEKSAKDFIVANFLQSSLTGDPAGAVGHIAPVAAYDKSHKRVLIFDPDREWYEPYWVPQKALVDGMLAVDKSAGKARGFIWIKTK